MKKAKPFTGMFYWCDTEGIPLEMVAARVQAHGFDLVWELRLYVLHAVHAGWSLPKIASELREATAFGLEVPDELLRLDQPQRSTLRDF